MVNTDDNDGYDNMVMAEVSLGYVLGTFENSYTSKGGESVGMEKSVATRNWRVISSRHKSIIRRKPRGKKAVSR